MSCLHSCTRKNQASEAGVDLLSRFGMSRFASEVGGG